MRRGPIESMEGCASGMTCIDRNPVDRPEKSWRTAVGVGIWLIAYLAACTALTLVRGRSVFLSVLAVFGIAGAARALHNVASVRVGPSHRSLSGRVARI